MIFDLIIDATLASVLRNPRLREAFGVWRLKLAVEAWERQRDRFLKIRHRLPGRLRLEITGLRGSPSLGSYLERDLARLEGVIRTCSNWRTGSLLVEYSPDTVQEAVIVGRLLPSIQLWHNVTGDDSPVMTEVQPGLLQVSAPWLSRCPERIRVEHIAGAREVIVDPSACSASLTYNVDRHTSQAVLALLVPQLRAAAEGRGQAPEGGARSPAGSRNGGWSASGRKILRAADQPRTVQERSMYSESSREKLVDILISSLTLALTSFSRRGGWRVPGFGLGRLFTVPAITSLMVGTHIFRNGLSAIGHRSVNADTLSTLAIFASLLAGKDLSALVIILLADIGEMVTSYSAERTREAIAGMLSVGEPYVWQVLPDGREQKVPLERIRAQDTIAVRLGEKISVDGVVVEGEASVDQASLTGEYMPMQKGPGERVFAGTLVKRGRLLVRAEQVGDATAVARIIHMVEDASQRRAPIQNFADKFSQQLVPISFVMAGLVYLVTRDLNRALNMLIIDYSCGVRLSTATAFSSSVFNAARQGILVKGGSSLEVLSNIDTLILDKTGTVTEGRPTVVELCPCEGGVSGERELLVWAATAEQHSTHPLADAVMSYVEDRGWAVPPLDSEEIVVANGVQARALGREVLVGSRRFLMDRKIVLDSVLPLSTRMIQEGQNVLYVALDGLLVGLIGVRDPLREDMRKALNRLRRLAVDDVILLTGDVEHSAEQIATRLSMDRFRANVLPEDKAEMVRSLQSKGVHVAMVGEGVNDAPALACADIGIAMGGRGTDLAIETADVTIAGDDPLKIPILLQISRQTMNIVRQNFAVAVGLNTLGLVLGAVGYIQPMAAALLHNLTTIGVVLNSTRLLVYRPK